MTNKKLDTTKPVLITSFVRLDQFKTTSEFGRVVGESLIDELSNRGFNIIEFSITISTINRILRKLNPNHLLTLLS